MYTISMRPDNPLGPVERCINFMQESESWELSTFKNKDEISEISIAAGVGFHSPLESIDISVKQLAAMIAGLDKAYEDLCRALYEDAPRDLAGTAWKDLDMFIQCVRDYQYESKPEILRTAHKGDVFPTPFLYDKESGTFLGYTKAGWGSVDLDVDPDSYNSAGTCFGWNVLYSEEMSTDCVKSPKQVGTLLCDLLTNLVYLDSMEKIYVHNIYSVQ